MSWLLQAAVACALAILLPGVINRTRALWSGRRGPKLVQGAYDLARLVRKRPVYSEVTGPIFQLAPLVVLATVAISALMVPLFGAGSPLSFSYDFVAVAYLWALGRVAMRLAALDTGSAFEGMGASREATWEALIEPALFLTLGTLAAATGHTSFADLLQLDRHHLAPQIIRGCAAVALFLVLQIEAGRVPIDDPATHLELTMVHEVMVLDHSGADLAALQLATGIKLTVCAALVAALLNPLGPGTPLPWLAAANLGLMFGVAIAVGWIESLTARLQLKAVPTYLMVASLLGLIALLTSAWNGGAT
jgi:formate hydrogenlyase subunit 4